MGFFDFLLEKKVIDPDLLASLNQLSFEEAERKVATTMKISGEDLLRLKSEYFGVPSLLIDPDTLEPALLELIPEKSIEYYLMIPIRKVDKVLDVGLVLPDNMQARDALDFIANKHSLSYRVVVVTYEDFMRARGSYQALTSEVGDVLTELESELSVELEGATDQKEAKEEDAPRVAEIIADAPITKIVATIVRYATEGGASDIHIEPLEEQVRVRFRIDGTMNTSLMLPKTVHNAVVARIKILCSMKLDEKRKPQDGRFSAHINKSKIDFRVSTFPTRDGEKVVMRILDSTKDVLTLEQVGLSPEHIEVIRDAIKQPFGLILISGPTGSGKSTTLYAMLNEIDKEGKNVLSLEDPVEYQIAGVSQSSVRPEIGYDFANGLRSILRQDPDIIMVGEIRDKETAALAIQAALTGHLVLSTIHTNNALGVIPRLVDMGVDPYLIAPTLIIAMAQRLVRKLCPGAGKKLPVEGSIKEIIDKSFEDLPLEYRDAIKIPNFVYSTAPAPGCPKGTRGRVAAFEIMKMNKEIERIILEDANEAAIYKAARSSGMLTMREDALMKVFAQQVPFEEVTRV